MVKFCPHDLFVNTRADLGVCPKVHDDEVKDLFEKAESSYKKAQYVEEFLRFCRHMINDVESKFFLLSLVLKIKLLTMSCGRQFFTFCNYLILSWHHGVPELTQLC